MLISILFLPVKNQTMGVVHGFWPEIERFDSGKKMMPCNSTSKGEHNDKISVS